MSCSVVFSTKKGLLKCKPEWNREATIVFSRLPSLRRLQATPLLQTSLHERVSETKGKNVFLILLWLVPKIIYILTLLTVLDSHLICPRKIKIFYTNLVIQIKANTRRPNKDPLEVKLLPVRPVGSPQFLQRNCGIGARTILNKGWSTPKIYVFIEIFIRIGRILKY